MMEEGKPGCLVTVSAAGRKFCTGFDLAFWNADPMNVVTSFARMLGVYRRLITLPIPTMAILNGHTYAGGFILAMCHDMRIMTSNKRSKVCLSEMNIGFPLANAFISVLQLTMSQEAQRPLNMGEPKDSAWCLANDVVTGLYEKDTDAEAQIKVFAKTYANQGMFKDAMKALKTRYFQPFVDMTMRNSHDPDEIIFNCKPGT